MNLHEARSVPRTEDPRFLAGLGTYVDDLKFPGMLHAVVVRSPQAHARIVRIDVDAARATPGGSIALRTRCTRRSEFVNVPSFSANAAAGRKTSARTAVSCMKRSCTTRKSSWANAFSA